MPRSEQKCKKSYETIEILTNRERGGEGEEEEVLALYFGGSIEYRTYKHIYTYMYTFSHTCLEVHRNARKVMKPLKCAPHIYT